MLAWCLLDTSSDTTKLTATLSAPRTTASLLALLKPDVLGDLWGFSWALLSITHSLVTASPGTEPQIPFHRWEEWCTERRTISQSNLPSRSLLPWFPSPSQILLSSPDPFKCAVPTLWLVMMVMEGAHCSPLLLLCVVGTECVIFVPSSEAVSCIPLCGLSSAISTFGHIW